MKALATNFDTPHADVCTLELGGRFRIAVERQEAGFALHVYPRTNGVLWDFPFTTFEVDEAEILALESEMGNDC